MVWIISLGGCPEPSRSPPEAEGTVEDAWPYCAHVARTDTVLLDGGKPYEGAGYSVAVGDTDDDGCVEIVAGDDAGTFARYEAWKSVYFLTSPESGALPQRAAAVWRVQYLSWVQRVALIGSQAVWLTSYLPPTEPDQYRGMSAAWAFDVPAGPLGAPVGDEGRAGRIYESDESHGFSNDIATCPVTDAPTACLTSINATSDSNDASGAVWLFDAPIVGQVSTDDRRTKISGRDFERAEHVEAIPDVDGDGTSDLLIGAFEAAGTGRVAVVTDPPPGDVLVWDMADATIDGQIVGGQLGIGMAGGDIDGDGHTDAILGAPIADGGYAYVVRGPLTGEQSVADAAMTVTGVDPSQWVGYDSAIDDFDDDGALDLAVGAPYSLSFGGGPGGVWVWPSPELGAYAIDEAPIHLSSGSADADGFGFSFATGDVDGDGRADLVIGAPTDSRVHPLGGSVTIVFGADL
jgi:hypothetical protein